MPAAIPPVTIVDFGMCADLCLVVIRRTVNRFCISANWVHRHCFETCENPHFQAPEIILGHSWGAGTDIWALGCGVSIQSKMWQLAEH